MKKNIWIMNHYAGDMFFDQGGRHYNFAKYLKIEGYEPVVFCANSSHIGGHYFDEKSLWHEHTAEKLNVPFVFVSARAYEGNGKQRILNMIDFYRNAKKAAKEYAASHGKPDVIYASSVHPLTLVAGIQLAKKFGVKCICEVRDLWPEAIFSFDKAKEKGVLGKCLVMGEHWIYKNADALIFTKEGDTDYLKEKGWTTAQGGDIDLAKCHYINNGVDLAAYTSQSTSEVLEDEDLLDPCRFNVVYTGTVRPVNNVGNILACAGILKNSPGYEKIQFLIFGDGSDLDALRKKANDEGLDNVKLKGFVPKKHIPYVLSKASVNLLNYSQDEYNWTRGNSSNKLFEYMASGKPVISTVKMGYSIINKYECGIELDECTPQCLAEAIVKFHNMSEQEYSRLGKNACEGAKDFDFEVLTKKLLAVIEGVTKKVS